MIKDVNSRLFRNTFIYGYRMFYKNSFVMLFIIMLGVNIEISNSKRLQIIVGIKI